MIEKTYNGWTNYETWNVALWIDNEQGSYNETRRMAKEAYQEAGAKSDRTFTRQELASRTLADQLKEMHEEARPDLGASVWSDLLGAALSEVNWYEIAGHYVDEVSDDIDEAEKEAGRLEEGEDE